MKGFYKLKIMIARYYPGFLVSTLLVTYIPSFPKYIHSILILHKYSKIVEIGDPSKKWELIIYWNSDLKHFVMYEMFYKPSYLLLLYIQFLSVGCSLLFKTFLICILFEFNIESHRRDWVRISGFLAFLLCIWLYCP